METCDSLNLHIELFKVFGSIVRKREGLRAGLCYKLALLSSAVMSGIQKLSNSKCLDYLVKYVSQIRFKILLDSLRLL